MLGLHGKVLVRRAVASLRTGQELSLCQSQLLPAGCISGQS